MDFFSDMRLKSLVGYDRFDEMRKKAVDNRIPFLRAIYLPSSLGIFGTSSSKESFCGVEPISWSTNWTPFQTSTIYEPQPYYKTSKMASVVVDLPFENSKWRIEAKYFDSSYREALLYIKNKNNNQSYSYIFNCRTTDNYIVISSIGCFLRNKK